MKKTKKGFTLVELLVVIAIIAILSTVSIVGYLSFTQKAKVSNDVSITTQMNTVLQANEATTKAKTMSDVRTQLLENGLDIEKLSPTTAGYNYVWDSKTNRILLLDENDKKVSPENVNDLDTSDTFVVLHKNADLAKWTQKNYSVYLASDFDATDVTLTTVAGVDTGNSNVKTVSISGNETETITVNGNLDKLTLDAASATVNQYGNVTTADVKAVDPTNSLHIFGQIIKLDVTKGHIVVEAQGEVSTVTDTNATANSQVSVEIKVSAKVGAVVSVNTNVLVQNSQKPANPEVVVPTENMKLFAGGIGTKESPYLISTEEQFFRMTNGDNYKLINDIDFKIYEQSEYDRLSFKGHFDGGNHKLFVGNAHSGKFLFFTALDNSSVSNVTLVEGKYLVGFFDYMEHSEFSAPFNFVFKNVNVINQEGVQYTIGRQYTTPFVSEVYNDGTLTYDNCHNYANIVFDDNYSGLFLGNYFNARSYRNNQIHDDNVIKVIYKNTYNHAEIRGMNVGLFDANDGNHGEMKLYNSLEELNKVSTPGTTHIYMENCGNKGTILGTHTAASFSLLGAGRFDKKLINAEVENSNQFTKGTIAKIESPVVTLAFNNGKVEYTQQIAGQASYRIVARSSVKFVNKEGSAYIYLNDQTNGSVDFIDEVKVDKEYTTTSYDAINSKEITTVDGWKYKVVQENGKNIAVVSAASLANTGYTGFTAVETIGKISHYIYVYDATGKLIASNLVQVTRK